MSQELIAQSATKCALRDLSQIGCCCRRASAVHCWALFFGWDLSGSPTSEKPRWHRKKNTQKVILMIKVRTWLWSASSFLRFCKSLVCVARRLSLRWLLLLLPLYLSCLPGLFLL